MGRALSYRGTEAPTTHGERHWTHRWPSAVSRGESHYAAKLCVRVVRELRKHHGNGFSFAALARGYALPYSTVRDAIVGETWRTVT